MDTKELNKKIAAIAIIYLDLCTDEEKTINGKVNPIFFRIRNFLLQDKHLFDVNYLHDYAETLTEKCNMSLTEFYQKAEKYRIKKIDEDAKAMLAKVDSSKYNFKEVTFENILKL